MTGRVTRRVFGAVMVALFLFGNSFAQSPRVKSLVLARVAQVPVRRDFAIVAAKIRSGTDTASAYRELDTLLSRAYGDMFWMYGCAGLYYATQDVLRPNYKARIRWCWEHCTPYRGDTQNHFLMYYGSLLLMSQAWPDLPGADWFMGKSSKEIYAESEQYLNHWIDETVRYGQEEWDSPRYGYYYITPLVLLAEYTKDSRLRHRFEKMLEYELAAYAADYLNGSYCGAHSRVSDECAINPHAAEIETYGNYFFGDDGGMARLDTLSARYPDVAFAAMTSFQCPNIIRHIATDRSESYEQFSIKRGRQMLRYLDKWSCCDTTHDSTFHAPVYKYDYMTNDYCLGSMQGGIVQPIQQQSWSLVFNSLDAHNIITGLNPYVSKTELGMFFPEYPNFMLERITGTKASYTSEDKWVGGSPYERIYQDKNVLVALYDLPDGEKYHHVDIFIPRCKVESNPGHLYDSLTFKTGGQPPGWIGAKLDSTQVFIYMMSHYSMTEDGIGWRIRCSALKTGYVVWCDPPKKWINRLRYGHWRVVDGYLENKEGGDVIKIRLKRSKANTDWLFRSPYLESKKGSGILTMRYKGETRTLNFNKGV